MIAQSIMTEGFLGALRLVFTGDRDVYSAAFVSLWVASASTVIASCLGLPLGLLVAFRRFPGRDLFIIVVNSLLAMPTVVVGLFVYAFIRRGSLFGPLDLLFTPWAMIAGQVILALPIAVALTHAAASSLDPAARETAISLGASPARVWITAAWEARFGLMAALAATGGRLIGEVGVSMMLGGNIKGRTRSLTTATALETSKGEFAFAMALGIVLLALALALNFLLRYLRRRGEKAA